MENELEKSVKAFGQDTAEQTAVQVGKTIRALRKAQGMTQEQLGHLAETDAGSISRIERGQQGWTHETITAIANALGVHVPNLFERLPSWMTQDPDDVAFIIVPHWRSLESTDPGAPASVPFPKAWIPLDVKPVRLAWLAVPSFWANVVLVDATCHELQDGRLFAFEHHGTERVRRVFTRYDKALRLVPESTSPEQTEEVIPPSDVGQLVIIGRVVWGGTPL